MCRLLLSSNIGHATAQETEPYKKLRFVSRFLVISSLAVTAGCSTRPLPKDVTRIPSYKIALKIRCELRDALQKALRGALTLAQRPDLTRDLLDGRKKYQSIFARHVKELPVAWQTVIRRYERAAVIYKFKFDIVEQNKLSGNLNFVRTFVRGPFNLALSGNKDKKRQNVREFTVLDTWRELITSPVMKRQCNRVDDSTAPGGLGYPISGKVGMEGIARNFIDLVQSGNLITSAEKPFIPTFTDTVTFTTTISGTINPTVTLAPSGPGFTLASAGLSTTSSRTDVHQMISVFFIPDKSKDLSDATVGQQRGRLEAEAAIRGAEVLQPALKELDRASARTEQNVLFLVR